MSDIIKSTVRKISIRKQDGMVCVCVLNDEYKYTCSEWYDEDELGDAFFSLKDIFLEEKKWTRIYETKKDER